MSKIFVTRKIPEAGIELLKNSNHEVVVSEKDGVLSKDELVFALRGQNYDAVVCLLTDKIDTEIFDASPTTKIFANYAVGFDNIDLVEAKKRGIAVTNTPGVLTNAVAEHAFTLLLSVAKRVVESDKFLRDGKYSGWAPLLLLGTELTGKTLGILGLGRIGSRVAQYARSFDLRVIYYDVTQNSDFEKMTGAKFLATPEELLREADFVSIHVPLLPTTRHLINSERLKLMKPSAILINTSRGPVIDEDALVIALRDKIIRGAGLDVFENEPSLAAGLAELPNVVMTPHTASATEEARTAMSEVVAKNVLAVLSGQAAPNLL